MFLINSLSHHFFATLSRSRSKFFHNQRYTFSRSYGVILPSSFTRVLSSALVYSTCPPVLVCGTVPRYLCLETFPGSMASTTSRFERTRFGRHHTSEYEPPDLPKDSSYMLKPSKPPLGWPSLLRPPIAISRSTGILTCFPSTTHFCLALGADSPCVD